MAYNPNLSFPGLKTAGTATGTGAGNPYGTKPNPIAAPNPAADLAQVYPNLTQSNTQASQNILGELRGELSPETIANLQDEAASFGVSSGMPLSGFAGFRGLRNLGLSTLDTQRKGLEDFNATTAGVSRTQTLDPALQHEINTQNEVWRSAPDPAAAAQREQDLFSQYMKRLMGPAGGTGSAGGASPWAKPAFPRVTYTPGKPGIGGGAA